MTKTKSEVTFREDPKKMEKMHARFERSMKILVLATIAFFVLLITAIITGVLILGDIAIAVVFLAWFPSIVASASASSYFYKHGIY